MVPWLPFWITREWIYPSLRSTNATSVMYLAELKHFNSLQSAHWVDCSPRLRIIFACVRPGFSRKIAQIARMFHHFFLLIRNICIYIYMASLFPNIKMDMSVYLSMYLSIYVIYTSRESQTTGPPPPISGTCHVGSVPSPGWSMAFSWEIFDSGIGTDLWVNYTINNCQFTNFGNVFVQKLVNSLVNFIWTKHYQSW